MIVELYHPDIRNWTERRDARVAADKAATEAAKPPPIDWEALAIKYGMSQAYRDGFSVKVENPTRTPRKKTHYPELDPPHFDTMSCHVELAGTGTFTIAAMVWDHDDILLEELDGDHNQP